MSKLFEIANAAVRRASRNRFAKTAVGKLVDELDRIRKGRGSEMRARHLIRELERYEHDHLIREIEQSAHVNRYSMGSRAIELLKKALGKLGPLGRVLGGMLDGNTKSFTDAQLKAARELLRTYGEEILTRPGHQEFDRGIQAAIKALQGVEDHLDEARQKAWDEYLQRKKEQEEAAKKPEPERSRVEEPHYRISRTHFTPQSSNVFSFMYDYMTSTLYVRYKAPLINTSAVKNVTGKGKMPGMHGKLGSTVIGKSDAPGPLYAYYDVPTRVYKRLTLAKSAGTAVWDDLRIRGTVWGHKFRYGLIGSPKVAGQDGQMAHYVPRRATKAGFRTRSLKGGGNRYVGSTLPEQLNRGERGRPDGPERGR